MLFLLGYITEQSLYGSCVVAIYRFWVFQVLGGRFIQVPVYTSTEWSFYTGSLFEGLKWRLCTFSVFLCILYFCCCYCCCLCALPFKDEGKHDHSHYPQQDDHPEYTAQDQHWKTHIIYTSEIRLELKSRKFSFAHCFFVSQRIHLNFAQSTTSSHTTVLGAKFLKNPPDITRWSAQIW